MATITVESMASTPLSTEEEENNVAPQPTLDQQVTEAMPAEQQPVQSEPPAPVLPTQPPQSVDEFTGAPDVQAVEQVQIEGKPPVLPPLFGSYTERSRQINETSPELRGTSIRQLQGQVADQYTRGVLQTGDKELDENRMALIRGATSVGIPKLDASGNIMEDSNGNPILLERYPLPTTDEGKVIGLFEFANNPNGIYLTFDNDGSMPTGGINLKEEIEKARTQVQGLERGFVRTQTMEGGMAFMDDVLKKQGMRPEKRMYYLRKEASNGDGSFDTIRNDIAAADAVPGLWNFGMMIGDVAQDHALSIPMTMMSLALPGDVSGALGISQTINPLAAKGFGTGVEGKSAEMLIDGTKKIIQGGRTMPLFTMTADMWAEKYGVSKTEAETVLGFVPDVASAITTMGIETAIFAPTFIKGIQRLDNQTFRDFAEHVGREYRGIIDGSWTGEGPPPSDSLNLADINKILTDNGVTFDEAFAEFAESRVFGSRAWLEGSIERSIQQRMADVGEERASITKDQVDFLNRKRAEVSQKIITAKGDIEKATTKVARDQAKARLKMYRTQQKNYQKELDDLMGETMTPPWIKEFLVDEVAIATPVAATTYALLYQATNGDEIVPGLGSLVSVVATLNPKLRRGVRHSGESLLYAAKRGLNKLGTDFEAPSPEAVQLARRLQGASPALRERIYAFMEDVSNQVVKYGDIKYPSGHPQAGEQILTEDVLYQSFAMMSGLSTLRALQDQAAVRNVNMNDMAEFQQELENIQNSFDERARVADQLGQVVQNLKFLEFDESFDPNSDAGKMVLTMRSFYENEIKQLEVDRTEFNKAIDDQNYVATIFSENADPKDVKAFVEGKKKIATALAIEMRRFKKYNIDPDLAPEQQEELLRGHLNKLQTQLSDMFEKHTRFSGARDAADANADFIDFVKMQEVVAFTEASNKFDILKTKFPEDARIDLTDIHDQIVAGDIELDLDVVDLVVPALAEGTAGSRSFVHGNLDARTTNALERLFGDSATEYMNYFRKNAPEEFQDLADEIFVDLKIEGASDYQKFLALSEGFKSAGLPKELIPRLGIDVTQLVQVVSGLGRSAARKDAQSARPINQLRSSILDRGETQFYTDFFNSQNRQAVEGLRTEYDAARQFYKSRYIDPFRNEDTTIRKIVKSGDNFRDLDLKSLDRFVNHFELNKAKTTQDLDKMQAQLATVIGLRNEDGTVKGIDVDTPEGKQVRSILTQLVLSEIASTFGGRKFRELLADQSESAVALKGLPKDVAKFVEGVQAGDIKGEAGINLRNFLGRDADGNYFLRDINGKPLIDVQEVDYFLSFDNLKRFSEDARQAETQFFKELDDAKSTWKAEFELEQSSLKRQLNFRSRFNEQLGQTDGNLGNAILKRYNTDTGPQDIQNIVDDFVQDQVNKGVPEADARADARQVVQQSVIDAVFDEVTVPGDKVAYQVTRGPAVSTETRRLVEIDPNKLLDVIGYKGDTVEATQKALAMRKLLGPEVYDHLQFVAETLYVSDRAVDKMNITGLATPLSAESQLSRVTSYFRGVISLRWLISEAAIREARRANSELTKMMLFNPDVGRQVLDLVLAPDFKAERFAQVYPVLLNQIAKNDVLMEGAVTLSQERDEPNREMEAILRQQTIQQQTEPTGEDAEMQLIFNP